MKDTSKLTKKQITDKNGKMRTVWVKTGQKPSQEKERSSQSEPSKKVGGLKVGDKIDVVKNGKFMSGVTVSKKVSRRTVEAVTSSGDHIYIGQGEIDEALRNKKKVSDTKRTGG